MNKKFIEEMRMILEQRKKDLEKSLEEVAQKSSRIKDSYEAKFPEYGTSEEEGADEVATFTDRVSLEENLETNLQETERALKKIRQGEYGLCEECGKEISEERLRVMPTARWCLACKNKLSK
ncbi:MAG: TraR/DksA family transcriptional regulator [Patescibacteria group bacterium]